ncbi:Pyridoxamine 5'-phosphate oxidase-like protein, partial [Lachnellula subtilissima]
MASASAPAPAAGGGGGGGEPPLFYEASAGSTHLQSTGSLPEEVAQCLGNARFLHLATCTALHPHVSLMNYTYLPAGSSPYTSSPTIIMTTNPASKKSTNLVRNPHVSLLVHDWVSHRPPTTSRSGNGSGSPDRGVGVGRGERGASSLAALLAGLNTSELSSISVTIYGEARLVDEGTEEEGFYRQRHLENNTFGDGEGRWEERERDRDRDVEGCDGGRESFIEGEGVRVVAVRITDGRVSDWKGAV